MTDIIEITIRELRKILFNIQSQEMTIRELRQYLTQLEPQDENISVEMLYNIKGEL